MDLTERAFENSNPIRLAWREWAIAALLCLAALSLFPRLWPAQGTRLSRSDYRLPGELSSDYWIFEKWSEYSRGHYQAVILGDSVVWGQYARSDDTLAHHLNESVGRSAFANLGVDGLHPAAMAGMITHYGRAIESQPVLLHLNPLWMSSPEQDLQTGGDVRFNHPKLLPQLFHRPVSYQPTPADMISAMLERDVPFLSWREHLKIAYLAGMAVQEWSLEDPYSIVPVGAGPDSISADEPGGEPGSWRERGITPQNLPWVEAERSYQWAAFRQTVRLLRSRGNRVFVLLGPFNTYLLTPESRSRYQALVSAMEKWLQREKVPYCAPRVLSTDMYADASHPLGDGYREIAKELLGSASFRQWLQDAPRRGRI